MAGKRRAQTARNTQSTPAFKRYSSPSTTRKSPQLLTLVLMGGAAGAVWYSLDDPAPEQAVIYHSVSACVDAGNSRAVCQNSYQQAQEALRLDSLGFTRIDSCESHYGAYNCTYDLPTQHFIPRMAGFTLATNAQDDESGASSSSSGGSYYGGGASSRARPFFRSRDRFNELQTPGDRESWRLKSAGNVQPASAQTVSRGGFGSSSRSWGG
ncbi:MULTISPECIES: DUF1190 domain-containing protein [Serratia]|uniref:DUF1190 domain-containing protein n=1 Tax=Serratia rhizosphaerae TaxID=2597702 RepID=A0ABX6GKY5_9GAMM|nr:MULTISPECIES: DUF1190 domain-containing protein [Serratia]MEB6337172.1 DUF1190 domain-containing protein [Serratia rhizosphaerae]QHA86940.1 DUF1190 domain-containing protein [Serratia rhizosphaerae]CAE1141785.1 conserved protein of unknown function [Serratia sp. Tan611]